MESCVAGRLWVPPWETRRRKTAGGGGALVLMEHWADTPLTACYNGVLCESKKNTPFIWTETEAIPVSVSLSLTHTLAYTHWASTHDLWPARPFFPSTKEGNHLGEEEKVLIQQLDGTVLSQYLSLYRQDNNCNVICSPRWVIAHTPLLLVVTFLLVPSFHTSLASVMILYDLNYKVSMEAKVQGHNISQLLQWKLSPTYLSGPTP